MKREEKHFFLPYFNYYKKLLTVFSGEAGDCRRYDEVKQKSIQFKWTAEKSGIMAEEHTEVIADNERKQRCQQSNERNSCTNMCTH